MMLIVMLVDEVQWRIREFRWQEIAPENSESGNQTPPAVADGQNPGGNDGSTASGSDLENPLLLGGGRCNPKAHLQTGDLLLGNVFGEEDEQLS